MAFYDKQGAQPGQAVVAGKSVPILTAPRLVHRGFLSGIWNGLGSLLAGMRITLQYVIRPSRIVTRQYPENRATLKMYERYRAHLSLVYDEQERHLCTVCRACEKACPNGSIIIDSAKGAVTSKNELQHFVWRFDSCTFCNLCVFTCPFDALKMNSDFEHAVFDRRLLVYNLNRYAGPHASLWDKVEGEPERQKLASKITPYEGPVPLAGTDLPERQKRALDPEGTK